MKMSEQIKLGQPWEIIKTVNEFFKADKIRNSLINENQDWEVKVKRMSNGIFTIRVRKPLLAKNKSAGRKSKKGKSNSRSKK
jgi:hypothetical protein